MNVKTLEYHDINRFHIISDTHFGVRSNSIEWIEIQYDFFEKFYIPYLKKIVKPGDAIIHLGDVFESRQFVNVRVMNMAIDIMKKLAEIMPVFIICGNHDIYYKSTNDINSIKIFEMIDNIKIFEDPIILELNNGKTKALLMPWQDTPELENEIIQNNKADYLFCHTDFVGIKFNDKMDITSGTSVINVKDFKGVYSGHIHFAQQYHNIRMVGCPYQISRSDIGNSKKLWSINFIDDTESYIDNTNSPIFLKIKLDYLLESTFGEIKKIIDNNYVDILIKSSCTVDFPFSTFIDIFDGVKYRKLNYIITTGEIGNDIDDEDGDEDIINETIDISSLINIYVENLDFNDKIKIKLKEVSNKLYTSLLNETNDNY